MFGLYGEKEVQGCRHHEAQIATKYNSTVRGVTDFVRLTRTGTDTHGVNNLLFPLVNVSNTHVNIQEAFSLRQSSKVRDCPMCLVEPKKKPDATSMLSRFCFGRREMFFAQVGDGVHRPRDGSTEGEIPHTLRVFGDTYVLRATIFCVSGGHQFATQVYLRPWWYFFNDMVDNGTLHGSPSYDKETYAGYEHMLMYVRANLTDEHGGDDEEKDSSPMETGNGPAREEGSSLPPPGSRAEVDNGPRRSEGASCGSFGGKDTGVKGQQVQPVLTKNVSTAVLTAQSSWEKQC